VLVRSSGRVGEGDIGTLGWIAIGGLVWLAAATVVGLIIGRLICRRDEDVPRGEVADPRWRDRGPSVAGGGWITGP
jgi:hypothetical protein